MARVNYQRDKRQKDLARQHKQEEKRQRRLQKGHEGDAEETQPAGTAAAEPEAGAQPDAADPA